MSAAKRSSSRNRGSASCLTVGVGMEMIRRADSLELPLQTDEMPGAMLDKAARLERICKMNGKSKAGARPTIYTYCWQAFSAA